MKVSGCRKYFSLILGFIVTLNLIGLLTKRLDLTAIATTFIFVLYWVWSIDTKVDRLEKALIKKQTIIKKDLKMSKNGASDLGNAIVLGLLILAIIYIIAKYSGQIP